MSDLTAPVGGADAIAPVPVIAPADSPPSINVSEAARQLASWRVQKNKPAEPAAPEKAAAEPPQELAEKPTSDPPQEAPAETDPPEPAEQPPIEAPRSWTKEDKEEFATYPREAQEKIARREQERETALRRSQNEAAERLKGLTTKEQQAEQVRQQYESALPMLLQTLQQQQQGEFADIKSMADVEKLAREDWPRYALWDAQQKKIAAVHQEVTLAQSRQDTERKQKWSEFVKKEDDTLLERAPELADKTRASKVADQAVAILKDYGINENELAAAWNGEAQIPLRSTAMQLLILDAVKYREAKANVAKPTPKPVPPVQRPGTAPAKGAAQAAQIEAAAEKLSTAKGNAAVQAGYDLLRASRAARR